MAKYSRVKQSGDIPTLASTADLPLTGLRNGETVFANGSFFVSNGSGWYRVTLVNEAPSITLSVDSISLGATGNTAYIGFTTVEPEGTPITVSIANNTANSTQANVNIYTSNNTLVVENLSGTAYDATITLTVSDGVNLGTDSLTVSVVFVDELWDETLLSVGTSSTSGATNSTFIDRSSNQSTVTTSGSPVQSSFHPYLDNWSVYFDGNCGLEATLPAITGDFTFECWYNWDGTYGNGGANMLWSTDTTDEFQLGFEQGDASWTFRLNGPEVFADAHSITVGTWHHIACVRNGTTTTLYFDGVALYNNTSFTNDVGSGIVNIGAQDPDRGFWHTAQGNITNFRISDTARYTGAFTPPTEPFSDDANTLALICSANRYMDSSSNDVTTGVRGTLQISSFNPFGQGSEYVIGENKGSTYFDGSSNIIVDDESASGSIYPADSDWTISCWFYGTGTGTGTLIAWGASGIYSPFNIYADQTNLVMRAPLSTTGSSWDLAPDATITGSDWKLNSWNHVEFCRSGTDFHFFLNGSLIRTVTSSSALMTPTQDITIGKRPTDVPYTGYIADMQYILGTALHTTNFTPPTSPVTHANSAMYIPMDNAGFYDKTGRTKVVRAAGSGTTSSIQTKYSATSLYFDGSTHYEADPITVQDFTFETWVYTPSGTTSYDLCTIGNSNSQSSAGICFYIYLNSIRIWVGTSSINTAITLNFDDWNHIAYTREGNTMRAFVNGALIQTITSVTWAFTGIQYIGAYYNNGISRRMPSGSYLENLQILNYAKYTQAFTPPNKSQGITYQAVS